MVARSSHQQLKRDARPWVAMGVALLVSFGLSGCLAKGRPVIAERAPVTPESQRQLRRNEAGQREYVVHRGDTLYSIAYRFQLDPTAFARANGVSEPYTIYPGQVLRIPPL